MRTGFVTCVQLGLSCMQAIYRAGGHLDLAITLPDDRAREKSGRVYLDDFCNEQGIPLIKSTHVNDSAVLDAVRSHDVDWLFIIGWSQIAGPDLLVAPKQGVLGIHPTLLPEGRGRASIPWAIIRGLRRTGVTMYRLDEGVDTGPIVDQYVIEMGPGETATSLYDRVCEAHEALMSRVWQGLVSGHIRLTPQDESAATVWPGRRPEDGRIEPGTMTVDHIDRLVRAVTRPYPGAFLDYPSHRLRVWAGTASPGSADSTAGIRITATDGTYLATDFEREPFVD